MTPRMFARIAATTVGFAVAVILLSIDWHTRAADDKEKEKEKDKTVYTHEGKWVASPVSSIGFHEDTINGKTYSNPITPKPDDAVIRAVRSAPLKSFVFPSSGATYGFGDEPWPETAPARPDEIYGISKWMGEQVMGRFHADRRAAFALRATGGAPEQLGDHRVWRHTLG